MHAHSNAAPAPKNMPVWEARYRKPAPSIATPAAAHTHPNRRVRLERRTSDRSTSMACALKSARGVSRATERSDSATQIAAVTTPAAAPITSGDHDT